MGSAVGQREHVKDPTANSNALHTWTGASNAHDRLGETRARTSFLCKHVWLTLTMAQALCIQLSHAERMRQAQKQHREIFGMEYCPFDP